MWIWREKRLINQKHIHKCFEHSCARCNNKKHNIGRPYTKDIKPASVYVTLAINDDHNRSHKMILSALSHFFKIKINVLKTLDMVHVKSFSCTFRQFYQFWVNYSKYQRNSHLSHSRFFLHLSNICRWKCSQGNKDYEFYQINLNLIGVIF